MQRFVLYQGYEHCVLIYAQNPVIRQPVPWQMYEYRVSVITYRSSLMIFARCF